MKAKLKLELDGVTIIDGPIDIKFCTIDHNFIYDIKAFIEGETPTSGAIEFNILPDDNLQTINTETMKEHKFITPVSMPCTQEQFEKIKGPLEKMGYSVDNNLYWPRYFICSNIDGINNRVATLPGISIKDQNRKYIEAYNPEHFLALAARTDKPEGIPGEWFKGKDGDMYFRTHIEWKEIQHLIDRKATVQEINQLFEGKEDSCNHCKDDIADLLPETLECPECHKKYTKEIEIPDQLYRLKEELMRLTMEVVSLDKRDHEKEFKIRMLIKSLEALNNK